VRVTAGRYEPARAGDWERLIAAAPTGTFLHTRRFLGYHPADRFRDASLLLWDERERLLGVIPAAAEAYRDKPRREARQCVIAIRAVSST